MNLQGAQTGAKVGSAFGPWGSAVGAVVGSLFGKKKRPMVVYGKGHPAIDRSRYSSNPYYRAAVDELYKQHVRQFGIGWTSTSDPAVLTRGIWHYVAWLKGRSAASRHNLRPDLFPAPAAPAAPQRASMQLSQLLALLMRR